MDRNVRYHRLPGEEVDEEEEDVGRRDMDRTTLTSATAADVTVNITEELEPSMPSSAAVVQSVQSTMIASPPPYIANGEDAAAAAVATVDANDVATGSSTTSAPKYTENVLPSYMIATELPTYDQVQQLKLEEQHHQAAEEHVLDPETLEKGDALLGTDFMFLCAFFVAFLFNWIGFLMLMCFCPTIAGRYGALAGFGLSLAKWTLIVKHNTELIKSENDWLWWLILAFGVLICVRAVLQYLHVKREWGLLTRATQERLMYFY